MWLLPEMFFSSAALRARCAATGTGSLGSVYCLDVEIQTASSAADCFYEDSFKTQDTCGLLESSR